MRTKPTVGIFGLTGCAGDQLVLLNCEDELLQVFDLLDIKDFAMAMSGNAHHCPLDYAFVEGSVVTPDDERMLKTIRKRTRVLVALGTCAVWGGIPAMCNEIERETLLKEVYGEEGSTFETGPARSLNQVVDVDLVIPGCPVEKEQVLKALASIAHGDPPRLPTYAVCTECKFKENPCLLVEKGLLCMGPLTVAGCSARCPSLGLPCNGCRGPVNEANAASEIEVLREKGYTPADIHRRLRTFAAPADAFSGLADAFTATADTGSRADTE